LEQPPVFFGADGLPPLASERARLASWRAFVSVVSSISASWAYE
jgi:hypothetical protein